MRFSIYIDTFHGLGKGGREGGRREGGEHMQVRRKSNCRSRGGERRERAKQRQEKGTRTQKMISNTAHMAGNK